MSFLNFASNKFFDEDDYALSTVAKARLQYNNENPDRFPLHIDLIESDEFYVLIADLPGVSKDRLNVSVKDDYVYLEGKRKKKVIGNDDNYLVNERRNGIFRRQVRIPGDGDLPSLTAKMEDGLLVLTIPRTKIVEGAKYIHIT